MATFVEAAAAVSRANADLALSLVSVAQDASKRWSELGAKVAGAAASAPVADKAYWDEIALVATDIRTSGFDAAQKAATAWQAACTDAWSRLETPLENPAFVSLFQAWSPGVAGAKAPSKAGATAA